MKNNVYNIALIFSLVLMLLTVFECTNKEQETTDDGGLDSTSEKDGGIIGEDVSVMDSGSDSGGECIEYNDEKGRCLESMGCYCGDSIESTCDSHILGTYEKAREWVEKLGSLTEGSACLYQCENGAGLLSSTDGSHGSDFYYSNSGELIAVYKWIDYPGYCDSPPRGEKWWGEPTGCKILCYEICKEAEHYDGGLIMPDGGLKNLSSKYPLCE